MIFQTPTLLEGDQGIRKIKKQGIGKKGTLPTTILLLGQRATGTPFL
jgi:hypothetical protein